MAPPHRHRHIHRLISLMYLRTITNRYRNPPTTIYDTFQKLQNNADRNMYKKLWIFLDEYNITLISRKTARLPLIKIGKTLLTKLLTNLGFKVTNLIQINRCRILKNIHIPSRHFQRTWNRFQIKFEGLQS